MSVSTSQELKGYQSQLARAMAEAVRAHGELEAAERRVKAQDLEISMIQAKIRKLQEESADPIVSEHALLRWMERVNGVDMDALRALILDEATRNAIKFAGSGKVFKSGHALIFKNNTIVTVE